MLDYWVWRDIVDYNLTDRLAINNKLLKQNPVSNEVAELLWSDPYYGLGLKDSDGNRNFFNYFHWANLVTTEDEAKK